MTNSTYAAAAVILKRSADELESFALSKGGTALGSAFPKTTAWCGGLMSVSKDNPARVHLGAAWSEIVTILALAPLSFYRQCTIGLRIVIDEILAWTYYKSHPVEFRTCILDTGFWVTKDEIFEFHKQHTWRRYKEIEETGAWAEINRLYKELSRHIHGQSIKYISLVQSFKEFNYDESKLTQLVSLCNQTDEAVGKFLASIHQEEFTQLRPELQQAIIKGWSKKTILTLGVKL